MHCKKFWSLWQEHQPQLESLTDVKSPKSCIQHILGNNQACVASWKNIWRRMRVDWIVPASQAERIGNGVKDKFPLKVQFTSWIVRQVLIDHWFSTLEMAYDYWQVGMGPTTKQRCIWHKQWTVPMRPREIWPLNTQKFKILLNLAKKNRFL